MLRTMSLPALFSLIQVYSKAGDKFDPQKKGGRWKPEFIWNTNWQEQLKIQEDLERQQKEYKEQQKKGGNSAAGPGEHLGLSARLGVLRLNLQRVIEYKEQGGREGIVQWAK